MPKKVLCKQILFLFLIMILAAGCFQVASTLPPPTPLGQGASSPLLSELLGKWKLNSGSRFGNAILEFRDDGTLIVTNTDDGTVKALQYTFVDTDTIATAGDDELAGTVAVKIENDEMQFDMTFADHVFGTIFPKLQRVK
jgi:hypothetical protein